MDFYDAEMTCVDELHLVGLNNLDVLQLEKNNLTTIAKVPCYNGTSIDTTGLSMPAFPNVHLAYNQLIDILCMPGQNTTNLYDISYNLLTSVTDSCLPNARYIYFLKNNLNTIGDYQQISSSNPLGIEKIKIQHNNITEIPQAYVNPLVNLKYLYITNNSLISLPNMAFCHTNIGRLEGQENNITNFDDIFRLENPNQYWNRLSHVNLEYNMIEVVSRSVLLKMESLSYLNLAYNRIAVFPLDVVDYLRFLGTLDLKHNAIVNVTEIANSPKPSYRHVYLTDNLVRCPQNLCFMVDFHQSYTRVNIHIDDRPCRYDPTMVNVTRNEFTLQKLDCYSKF